MPQPMLEKLVKAESNFIPDAVPLGKDGKPTSSACGLTQLIDSVLYEKLYEYGEQYHFDGKKYIEKTAVVKNGQTVNNYKLRDESYRGIVKAACVNPFIGTALGAEHLRDTMFILQERFGRNVNAAEAYIGYVFGPNGGGRLIAAYNNPKQQKMAATSFAAPGAVKANHNLFLSEQMKLVHIHTRAHGRGRHHVPAQNRFVERWFTHHKSVSEVFAYFTRKMGTDSLPMMVSRQPKDAPAQNMPVPNMPATNMPIQAPVETATGPIASLR